MIYERMKELADKYNSLKTDKERLFFLKEHNDVFLVNIENHDTLVDFIKPETMDQDVFMDLCEKIPLNALGDSPESLGELFDLAGLTVRIR